MKSGEPEVRAPVYSHLVYDVIPGETVDYDTRAAPHTGSGTGSCAPNGSSRANATMPTAIAGAEVAGIDESLTFYPLKIAVLTVSDTRTEETDKSGALLATGIVLLAAGAAVRFSRLGGLHAQGSGAPGFHHQRARRKHPD